MAGDFPGLEHAMARTLEVAERCDTELELGRILLPRFPVSDDRDAFDYLVQLCEQGLAKRYGRVTPELTRSTWRRRARSQRPRPSEHAKRQMPPA